MILDCNEIIQSRLWVGSYVRPEEVRFLRQLGITSVLSLQSEKDLEDYNIPLKKLLKAHEMEQIQLHRIPTIDFDKQALAENLSQGVEELEKALSPRWSKVYLHCTAGINRAPTLAAAYLIKVQGLSAQEAYDYVTTKRRCSPYIEVLQEYETSVKASPVDREF